MPRLSAGALAAAGIGWRPGASWLSRARRRLKPSGRRWRPSGLKGILLLDKAQDWTSQDAVAKLRGILRERRIGHAGTLDPLATGLLVVLVGRATRAAAFAEAERKEYVAAFRPGLVTDTQDITGNLSGRSGCLTHTGADLPAPPPVYGAAVADPAHVQRREDRRPEAVRDCRRGQTVDRPARPVTVYELEYLRQEGQDHILRICCSKGTYIRTLCHDLGQALGCGGAWRAAAHGGGSFRVEDAHTLESIRPETAESLLLPVEALFAELPAYPLTPEAERQCRCGASFPARGAKDGEYRFIAGTGEFLALGRIQDGHARSIKSFFEVS